MLHEVGSFVGRLRYRDPREDQDSPEVMAKKLDDAMRQGSYKKYIVIVQRDQALFDQSSGASSDEQYEALEKVIAVQPLIALIVEYAKVTPRQRVYDVAIKGQGALARMVFNYNYCMLNTCTTDKYRMTVDLVERGARIREEDCDEVARRHGFANPNSRMNSLAFWQEQLRSHEQGAVFGRIGWWSRFVLKKEDD